MREKKEELIVDSKLYSELLKIKNDNNSVIHKFRLLHNQTAKFNPFSFRTRIIDSVTKKSFVLSLLDGNIDQAHETLRELIAEYLDYTDKENNCIGLRIIESFKRDSEISPDLERAKGYYLDIINSWLNKGVQEVDDITQKGFNSYIGIFNYSQAAEKILDRTINTFQITKSYIDLAYLGFSLAHAQSFIQKYSDEPADPLIEPNQSPLTTALVLKHLGIIDYLTRVKDLSNDKGIQLLAELFNTPIKATSIGSSFRDEGKRSDSAKKKASAFLRRFDLSVSYKDLAE